MKIDEKIEKFLNEASKPGRAWSGKISRIDDLLAWMYDKGILTKGEQAEKDKIFRQYHRYYNDGDLPGAMRKQGHSLIQKGKYHKGMDQDGEAALEKYLETFIKKILGKYMSKIDRSEFRIDKAIGDLTIAQDAAKGGWGTDINYWVSKANIKDEGGQLATLIDKMKNTKDAAESKNIGLQVAAFIGNVIASLNKLKAIDNSEK